MVTLRTPLFFITFILFQVLSALPASASEKVVLQLAWKHQFQFAGYYAALHKGYYRELGLDVEIVEGGEGKFAREELLEGHAQYGIAGAELLLHRMDGAPFVVLAPIFQHSPSILLSKKEAGIHSLHDLIGKTVMLLPGKKDADILAAFLSEGIDLSSFKRVDQTYNLNDLIDNKVDAVSAYLTNEPWYLTKAGIEPSILSPRTYGVDFYSDCLFTTEDEIKKHPARVKSVIAATLRGWQYAMDHPQEISKLLGDEYGVDKSEQQLLEEAEAIRSLMLPDLVEIGTLNPGRWRHIGETYVKLGLLAKDFSLDGFFIDTYLSTDYAAVGRIALIFAVFILLVSTVAGVLIVHNMQMSREINERKRAEEALKKSEQKFRLAFNTNPAPMTLNRLNDGLYLEVNDSFCRTTGYTRNELIGHSSLDLEIWEDEKDRDRLVEGLAKNGYVDNLEARFKGKDGTITVGVMFARLIEINREKALLSITHDITHRREIEEEKARAQQIAANHEKYALVGQVAGKIAHDFNNILGTVMGNAELALLDCHDEATRKTLELIFAQAIRGRNLTKNLVAFAKDQEPKHEYFNVNDKVDLVLSLIKKDLENIALRKDFAEGLPELLADPGMVEHSLVNLLQNAIHATSMSADPAIALRTCRQDEQIAIEISDNGCGIPEQYLDNIMDPAFTLKGSQDKAGVYHSEIKGTGYGMANVKKYIEQHKGTITVVSTINSGTTVTLTFPILNKELSVEEISELKEAAPIADKRILLLEDEKTIADVQYRILSGEPCRHRVDVVDNGEEAINLLQKKVYDMFSLDYALPGGISGLDVYHSIREIYPHVPVLFISGNLEFLQSIKELQKNDPHLSHLSKPTTNKEYIDAVSGLLHKNQNLKGETEGAAIAASC